MRVVVWSGGLDSTLILADELAKDTAYGLGTGNVKAITLSGHRQLDRAQIACERAARAEFKRWAKARGWKFRHETVRVKTSGDIDQNVGQSGMWLCHLMPYLRNGDTALFGYIRGDDFWHHRHLFVSAFGAVAASHYSDLKIEFPLEWHRKRDVVDGARRFRMPRRVWWTCDRPKNHPTKVGHKPCGKCGKCRGIKRAHEDLKTIGTSHGVTSLRPPGRVSRGVKTAGLMEET